MVWNGVGVVDAPDSAYWPVMNGTFWPTSILASSLSVVKSVGVERMLALLSFSSARTSSPRLSTWPLRPGILTTPFIMPTFKPVPADSGFFAMPRMFWPVPPKFVPPNSLAGDVVVAPVPLRSCH